MKTHTNKTVIVIGATGGIGKVLVQTFYNNGYTVVVSARTKEKLESLISNCDQSRVLAVPADASSRSEIENVFSIATEKFSIIDAIVIAAGTWRRSSIDTDVSESIELAHDHFDALFMPAFTTGLVAQNYFRKQGHGLIANISSHAAIRPHLKGNLTYTAMKAAVHAFILSLDYELEGKNVRATDIMPAIVDTPDAPLTDEQRLKAVQPQNIAQWIINNIDNPNIEKEILFDSEIVLD